MNLARGLRRLATAAALLWIVAVGAIHWDALRDDLAVVQSRLEMEWRSDDGAPTLDTPLGRFTPSGELAEFLRSVRTLTQAEAERRLALRYQAAVARLRDTALLMVGPPLGLAVLLLAVGWVARGFRA
ncbi:hypothetical protein [Azospirillum sp. ST 5-10]|uniref:hypothetical protein n=1 Tax=unclassified Azospirillum TaxID=2630922 RepID=UPI003F49CE0E